MEKFCQKCGDRLTGHEDDTATHCRWCSVGVGAKRFVFPLIVLPWSSLASDLGVTIKPGPKMKAVGYIPVYENIPTLVDDFGTDQQYGTFERKDDVQAAV